MIDFINKYRMHENLVQDDEEKSIIVRSVFDKIIPIILENELTSRQKNCIELSYFKDMSQREIAENLGVTQPTVSRHIRDGVSIVNRHLSYCYFSVVQGLNEYE